MDATSLLGGMLGAAFGKGRGSDGPGVGTVAAGVAGAAAVGGLGYLAYRHFKGQPGQPGQPMGAPGQPMGPAGQPMGAPQQGGVGGFFSQMVGQQNSLRHDGFSAPGYEYQQQAAPPPDAGGQPQPYFAPWTRPAPPPAPAAPPPPAPTADQQSHALLLIRAMVAAAYADGVLDDKERADILSRLDQAGVTSAERAGLERELAAPQPITALCAQVPSPEIAEQFYLVSLVSVNADTEAEKAHLRMLPALLKLSPEQVAALHQKTGLPTP